MYVGQWENGKKHGWGKYTYPTQPGDICEHFFEGEWAFGDINGNGKVQLGNGTLKEGYFNKGKFVGPNSDTA